MGINIEKRPSDSPFVEMVWRSRSEDISTFISIAGFQLDLVVWKEDDKIHAALIGPETRATTAPVPSHTEFFGIIFRPGVFMPHLSLTMLVDRNFNFSISSGHTFWLKNATYELPTYENAESFVKRLVRDDILAQEPVIESVLRGCPPDMSLRSVQRRFLGATGLSYRTMQQIDRARQAAILLRQGVSILDTVYETGYFDQAYLTKSLKYFIGQTPTQLIDTSKSAQLSLLYKTHSFR